MSNKLCQIHKIVDKVYGSASHNKDNIDTWILHIKYAPETDTFIFKISVETMIKSVFARKQTAQFRYETFTYKYILDNLIRNGVIPNFITYLDGSTCTYGNLRKILEQDESMEDIDLKLHRNITLMANKYNNIPMINSDEKIVNQHLTKYIIPHWVYDVQLFTNEDTENTFEKYIVDRKEKFLDLKDQDCVRDLFIIFNICIICYAMSLSVMSHTQMTLQNIALKKLDAFKNVSYELFDTSERFMMKTDVSVMVINFQNAFVRKLGKRKSELNNNCINENLDIMTVFGEIFKITKEYEHVRDLLYPLIVHSVDENVEYNSDDDLYKFNSTEDITVNFFKMLKDKDMLKNVDHEEYVMFVCKQSLFNDNGIFYGNEQDEGNKQINKDNNNMHVFDYQYYTEDIIYDIPGYDGYQDDIDYEEKNRGYIKYFDIIVNEYESIKKFLSMVGQEYRLEFFSNLLKTARVEYPTLKDEKYNILIIDNPRLVDVLL